MRFIETATESADSRPPGTVISAQHEVVGRREDVHAVAVSKAAGKDQQILVAGDQELRLAIEGDVQQPVVLGVAAGLDAVLNGDHANDATEQGEELPPIVERHVAVEPGAGQDVGQFVSVVTQ